MGRFVGRSYSSNLVCSREISCNFSIANRSACRVVPEDRAPRETGFQGRLQKRREKSERIHGASRNRDDGLSVPSRVLMGDDGSSLRDRQQRSNDRRSRKNEERNVRLMAAKAKEDAMKEFGLNNPNAQRIKIQPRRN